MQTTKQYRRLSAAEREEISRGIAQGDTISALARRLGRAPSSISREVKENSGTSGYRAFSAGNRARASASSRRSGKRRLTAEDRLRAYVLCKLKKCWSPEEIVKRMREEYPDDTAMRISHEAIYQYVYVLPRGELKRTLIHALRQERKYRRKKQRRGNVEETRGKIADMRSIEERPAEVAGRVVPGHWEGDLILGKYKRTALGTLVERATRKTILVPLAAKDAESVRKAYAREFRILPRELAKTLTHDQGKEMSGHKQFTVDTGIQVYFAHPGSPWERGTNENTNGLVRQYFPKGTDFSRVSAREIKKVERELNYRPRKVLHWKKPDEVFNQLVALKV
ncbi:MAG: IS30 family transposase [Candidatus Liptonbacteria bacterium]|nr:IS30 family transposase [Candidatus Liptonbacteria bacterium]